MSAGPVPSHTKEPWQKLPDTSMIRWVEIPAADYKRAVACVEALAGIADPAAELARLRACEAALKRVMAGQPI